MSTPDQTTVTDQGVRDALRDVRYPGAHSDIVSAGLLRSVAVRDGRVHVSLAVATTRADVNDRLRALVRERVLALGARRCEVQVRPPDLRTGATRDPWADRGHLPHVARIVAVGSGKGGVGKSTVAANLALALHAAGLRTGVLDADIYGPSIPVILGLEDGARRIHMSDDRRIRPLEAHGLAVVSFGFFLGPESPAVWRGPMVGKAVKQFSRGVLWPELDILVVDLPPGTGDVPLSLAQSVVVDGAIVVTTPQRLAALEAGKALEMFRKLDVPVLGVVENMSHAACECGHISYPFGRGAGAALAAQAGVPLLAGIPFDESVVEGEDHGQPPALGPAGGSAVGQAFAGLAAATATALGFVEAGAVASADPPV